MRQNRFQLFALTDEAKAPRISYCPASELTDAYTVFDGNPGIAHKTGSGHYRESVGGWVVIDELDLVAIPTKGRDHARQVQRLAKAMIEKHGDVDLKTLEEFELGGQCPELAYHASTVRPWRETVEKVAELNKAEAQEGKRTKGTPGGKVLANASDKPKTNENSFASVMAAVELDETRNVDHICHVSELKFVPTAKGLALLAGPLVEGAEPSCPLLFSGDCFPIDREAVNVSKDHHKVPESVTNWLWATGHRDDLAKYLTESFGAVVSNRGADSKLLRMRRGKHSNDLYVRAIKSRNYAKLDNAEALGMIADSLGDLTEAAWFPSSTLTDSYFSGLLSCEALDDFPGDSGYEAGIGIRNGETGRGSFLIMPMLWRTKCKNGLVHRVESDIFARQVHYGEIDREALAESVNQAVKRGINRARHLLRILQEARTQAVADVPRLITYLGGRFVVSKEEARAWYEGWEAEPEYTVAGVVNGLTRAAQGFGGEHRLSLEAKAGEILTPHPDSLDYAKAWAGALHGAELLTDKKVEGYLFATA